MPQIPQSPQAKTRYFEDRKRIETVNVKRVRKRVDKADRDVAAAETKLTAAQNNRELAATQLEEAEKLLGEAEMGLASLRDH